MNDGSNGYAWLFSTSQLSIHRIRPTRSSRVAAEVLGTAPLPGVLVVDRYGAYSKRPPPKGVALMATLKGSI